MGGRRGSRHLLALTANPLPIPRATASVTPPAAAVTTSVICEDGLCRTRRSVSRQPKKIRYNVFGHDRVPGQYLNSLKMKCFDVCPSFGPTRSSPRRDNRCCERACCWLVLRFAGMSGYLAIRLSALPPAAGRVRRCIALCDISIRCAQDQHRQVSRTGGDAGGSEQSGPRSRRARLSASTASASCALITAASLPLNFATAML
jgi:hypothetical protein